MGSCDIAAQPAAGWDEARCIAALAQLERLQEQLDDLRLAIPRMVEPFNSDLARGPVVFKAFKQSVIRAQNDMKAFRAQWHNQDNQSILEHAKESYNANTDLSASSQVPRYGWVLQENIESQIPDRIANGGKKVQDSDATLSIEEISQIIQEFHKAHPNIKIGAKDDNHELLIQFVAGDLKLKFRVIIDQEANGRHKLNAECLGTMKLFPVITKCISTRPHANDLKYLLDMIAAYKTTKGASCAKCSRLLDSSALAPAARRSRQVGNVNKDPELMWEAFHESCLE
ncbi:uncharacterized protein BDR25DRAFT_323796 [Lindgomyces ingoldianus]|uniref:Uncharacterized protein n=1 Tax=Lindgomyces ingoldianus TaxID=673940 RepID=A0ACB6R1R8_9PLEO|nr:uncharacterized protein BDR25DRAFT_323796 [Lindgomyces ingoldianus]KAF2473204.1 hypothetical protein BDR25DRAFT_323796 [Lindgomyces ingoldianus]